MRLVALLVPLLVAISGVKCQCDPTSCNETCHCMSSSNPGGLDATSTPQLVMLTFDDAVSHANFDLYKSLFLGSFKNPSGCHVGATFFATHEYTNYAFLHQLYQAGNEIAVHSITHEPSTDMWKTADYNRWKEEAVGMRNIIAKHALIPASDIKGFRSPFLQTAGNTTFKMLRNEGFLYDSSLPTRAFAGLHDGTEPIWPFTLDHPFSMDCAIPPCPNEVFPGLWIVPLISMFKMRTLVPGLPPEPTPCAMADACLPFPETANETVEYFMENFNRHYLKNRAPFPIFLHEAWLKNENRREGYIQFFDYLQSLDDVYIVTIQEVLEFIRNPSPLDSYREKRCVTEPVSKGECSSMSGLYCYYEHTELEGSRPFFTCAKGCPSRYPWLGTETRE